MTDKANKLIRKQIDSTGLAYWQIAERIGVTAGTFTLWMRVPLKGERKDRTEKAINELKG